MDQFISLIMTNFQTIDWQGPAAFVVALMAVFALMHRWSLILLVILTIVLGWGAQDMIVLNLTTQDRVISMPFLIYLIGSVTVFFLAMISFFSSK